MTKRQNEKSRKDRKTKREKERKTKKAKDKRQRPKREFYIVTSGQFCTLAMFFVNFTMWIDCVMTHLTHHTLVSSILFVCVMLAVFGTMCGVLWRVQLPTNSSLQPLFAMQHANFIPRSCPFYLIFQTKFPTNVAK